MTQNSNNHYPSLINELRKLSKEAEWVEFKQNQYDEHDIGEYISAIANSAALVGKIHGYIVWGIENETHGIVGTKFDPHQCKIGNEELESWLLQRLKPKINFKFVALNIDNKDIVLLEINSAISHPVQFQNTEFIRVGSYKKRLKDFPEKERELWRILEKKSFEKEIAATYLTADEILQFLDYPAYFDLTNRPLPDARDKILGTLSDDDLIGKNNDQSWHITNLGAILFAKKLEDFKHLSRKAVRVIQYKGASKIESLREQVGSKGYAAGFEGLISFIVNLLPTNEVLGQAIRKSVPMFPEIAIRELVANAIIHQDFFATGTSPMIEIFSDRIEITNPGLPLVKTDRFLDNPPKSRNEALASFMRRIGICEERGSGVDKIVFQTELYQLPAPIFETTDEHTRSILFAHKELRKMDKDDRVRACYLHACLKYVRREVMTNTSLRERFGIEEKNQATVSRILTDTMDAGLIQKHDPDSSSRKFAKYVPFWA